MLELLQRLTQINSPSGSENAVSDVIRSEIAPFVDEVYSDELGNLIAHKRGHKTSFMLAAHMDEIGVIVTFIDDNGFLRFAGVGGLYIKELVGRRVVFSNGTTGVIGSEEDFSKDSLISKLYIDIGAQSRESAEKSVSVGDTAAFVGGFTQTNDIVISKALDNRAGCYILIEAAKRAVNSENEIYYVFTVQEEVGLRGARTAAFGIDADYAIAVDVTDTGDTPEAPAMAVSLGKGAAVKVMDHSILCHHEVRAMLIEAAKSAGIDYQLEIMTDGGTDAGAIHLSKSGVKTGGVSLPTRYIHSPSEMASVHDIESCIKLICEAISRNQ